jgi:hypothetical protein
MARRSAQNIETISQATTVLTEGPEEISREWFDVVQDRLANNEQRGTGSARLSIAAVG